MRHAVAVASYENLGYLSDRKQDINLGSKGLTICTMPVPHAQLSDGNLNLIVIPHHQS